MSVRNTDLRTQQAQDVYWLNTTKLKDKPCDTKPQDGCPNAAHSNGASNEEPTSVPKRTEA
jgi:hypothetical protein